MYDRARLAAEDDVIVVTIRSVMFTNIWSVEITRIDSYRANIFGFSYAQSIPHQNLGKLDQRLAVE